jgi:hypothetical protein
MLCPTTPTTIFQIAPPLSLLYSNGSIKVLKLVANARNFLKTYVDSVTEMKATPDVGEPP